MLVPANISSLIKRFNYELDRLDEEVRVGISLTEISLNRFPSNEVLIQFFAYLSSSLLLVEVDRRRIQAIINNFLETDIFTDEDIQEIGETIGAELGRIIEAKLAVIEIKKRLEELQ